MGSFGFLTEAQTFKPQQLLNPYGGDIPRGSNMIGILPGEMWRTPDDCIHVVGAHWDTVKNTRGLDDNSSGVAAILEMVRALYHGECENKYTVIIVTWRNLAAKEVFVQDFLTTYFPPASINSAAFPTSHRPRASYVCNKLIAEKQSCSSTT